MFSKKAVRRERQGKTKAKTKSSIGVSERESVVKGSVNEMSLWGGGEKEMGWMDGGVTGAVAGRQTMSDIW